MIKRRKKQKLQNTKLMDQFTYFSLLIALSLQIYLPCYFGNEIITKSNELSTDIYKSNWRCFRRKHQNIIIIFMERLKRTVSVVVGGLFLLSLQTFTSVTLILSF